MALLFMDSFDHYVTADITEKWTNSTANSISAGNGRRSSASLRFTGGAGTSTKGVSASGATAILGFAVRVNTLAGGVIRLTGVYDGGANRDHVYLILNADGSLSAFRGTQTGMNLTTGTSLGTTAAGVISANTYTYLELKVVIHGTTGSVVLRANGLVVLNLTGQNTTNAGTLVWTAVWLSGQASGGPTLDYDDLYVLDGSGSAPWTDFLGDCRVDVRLPTAAGATTGWTPSTGANWQNVDDAAPNDDTDYNTAASAGLTDTFVVQDAPVVGAAIYGVQHCLSAKKTDAGAASIAAVIRHSGVDYVGANANPGTTYAVLQQINQTNPGTAAAWTEAGFNAAEFGYKRTA